MRDVYETSEGARSSHTGSSRGPDAGSARIWLIKRRREGLSSVRRVGQSVRRLVTMRASPSRSRTVDHRKPGYDGVSARNEETSAKRHSYIRWM